MKKYILLLIVPFLSFGQGCEDDNSFIEANFGNFFVSDCTGLIDFFYNSYGYSTFDSCNWDGAPMTDFGGMTISDICECSCEGIEEESTTGCTDPLACNYDADATIPGDCIFADECSSCVDGVAVANDTDGDGVNDCDEELGCTDNYLEITLEAYDSYGDGWNDALLNIYFDEVLFDPLELGYTYTLTNGDFQSFEFCIDQALLTGCLIIDVSNGLFSEEISWNLYDSATYGNVFSLNGGAPFYYASENCIFLGCTDSLANNFDSTANVDDGSCEYLGCTDSLADNFDSTANVDNGSCEYWGCMDPSACNFDPNANRENGSCIYDLDGDGVCTGICWEQLFNGKANPSVDYANSVKQTDEGGYIICGGMGFGNGWLIKTDLNGNTEWSQIFDDHSLYDGQQTNDGGYIITGSSPDGIFLLKIDEYSNVQWSESFEGDDGGYGASVKEDGDGDYIICGTITSNIGGVYQDEISLIRTNVNGVEELNTTLGEGRGQSIQITNDGGYIIIAHIYDVYGTSIDGILLIKTNENGIVQWDEIFIGTYDFMGSKVEQNSDGGYMIYGSKKINSWGETVGLLIKTDENGIEEWSQTFTQDEVISSNFYSGQQTNDGGYILCGELLYSVGDVITDIFVVKTDENGEEEWSQTYGGQDGQHVGKSIQQTSDGGYIIGSEHQWAGANQDIILIKTDENGLSCNNEVTSSINEYNNHKTLIKVVDVLGREIDKDNKDALLLYIYDDGSIDKKYIVNTK